jgi:SNF2 family DNA or RNA helicase
VSGFNFDVLTGEVDQKTRMDMVDRFQDPNLDYYILLISTRAGGVGLNLTAVSLLLL